MKIKRMDFLISLYITCLCLAEITSMKTVPLINILGYQLNASVGIFVFPILFVINDVITEVKGKARAKSLVYSSLFMVFLIMIFSIFATYLPASSRFKDQEAYSLIFGKTTRICFASLIAFLVSGLLDVSIFHKLKEMTHQKMLWLRGNVSNFISQFVDTSVFMIFAFYSFQDTISVNFTFLASIIIPYWLLKCFMSAIQTPLTYWGVSWLKAEK